MNEKQLVEFVKPIYAVKDSMHNFNHILRIKKKVGFLRKGYSGINEDKLQMIIYFHGAKEWLKKNKKKFLKLGFTKQDLLLINRHTKNPRTIEEKLVSDANLLEAVGKFGIKKAMQVGKERGRTKKETIQYIAENINKIKFYTISGQILGNKGIKIIRNFIKSQK